jgi:protein-S-isoprenylcysteine O-methyltransferase Ste14
MTPLDHLLYGLAWISFGAVHSLLARPPGDAWMGRAFGPGARLAYNAISVVHLAAVWGFGRWLAGEVQPFARPDWLVWLQWAMVAGGALLGWAALKDYDLGRFGGLWYLRSGIVPNVGETPEPLVVEGLHRYVRHPLYSAAFLLLWGLVDSPFSVATAAWASLYFLIGTWFEERKLVRLYGEAYRAYRRRVPAYLPWKGRVET